jgi:hypothetical protein
MPIGKSDTAANCCDGCGQYLGSSRVIVAHEHFCSMACYDRWDAARKDEKREPPRPSV